jgi:hypothetical protein
MDKNKSKKIEQPKPIPMVVYKPIPKFGAGCKNC